MENMEYICAKYGMQIGDNGKDSKADAGNVINKALGTLTENGLYAMTLLLTSQTGAKPKAIAIRVLCSIMDALNEVNLTNKKVMEKAGELIVKEESLTAMRDLAKNFHNLLMAKRLIEQILTFARYHVKSLPGE